MCTLYTQNKFGAALVPIDSRYTGAAAIVTAIRAAAADAPVPTPNEPAAIAPAATIATDADIIQAAPIGHHYQYLPAFAKIAIERADADSSLRNGASLRELCAAYAKTYGAECDAHTLASVLHICARRFWDYAPIVAAAADAAELARLTALAQHLRAVSQSANPRSPSADYEAAKAEVARRRAVEYAAAQASGDRVRHVPADEFDRTAAALQSRAAREAVERAAMRGPGSQTEKLAARAAAAAAHYATPTRTFSTEKPDPLPALSDLSIPYGVTASELPAADPGPVRKKSRIVRTPSRWALFDRHGIMVTWSTGTRGKNSLTRSIDAYSYRPSAPHTVSKVTHDTCNAWSAAKYAADRAASHVPPTTPTPALSTATTSTPPPHFQRETGPEWFARVQREVAGKLTRAESLATTPDGFVEFTHADGVRFGLAGEDMSEPGRFRFTYFDDRGPIGHSTRDTLAAAIWEGMDLNYVPIEPGTPTRVIGDVAPPPTDSQAKPSEAPFVDDADKVQVSGDAA